MYNATELIVENGVEQLVNIMNKRRKDKVTVNGRTFWISGYSNQELYESYVDLLEKEGLVARISTDEGTCPLLSSYIEKYYKTYKTNQQLTTTTNRNRIIRNHILPQFGDNHLDEISIDDIQNWFNDLAKTYSKETIAKIKNILSPVLDAAVEDGYISRNPIKSKRIENNGHETEHHKAIPHEKIIEIKDELPNLDQKMKYMGGLLAYTGMRFEEVLGARFEDLSSDGWFTICRAVVHPDRNMPVLKCTKTVSSDRIIPCPEPLQNILRSGPTTGFIMASSKDPLRETPMSYTEARRVFDKLKKRFGISAYTPHDFRDTCATEWRKNGMSLDMIARLLGHAKTETTEKRYVKYNEEVLSGVREMM